MVPQWGQAIQDIHRRLHVGLDYKGTTTAEVRVYNRALSTPEIQADMSTPCSPEIVCRHCLGWGYMPNPPNVS